MRTVVASLLLALLQTTIVFAKDDVPNGYMSLEKLAEAQTKAKTSKKLVAVLAKGSNDQCPYCVDAFAKGTQTLKSDCVMVFSRVPALRADANLPKAVKDATASAGDGASVSFYVFDPDLTTLVATINRQSIEKDPKSLRETKKVVNEAQKKLVAVPVSKPSALDALKRN